MFGDRAQVARVIGTGDNYIYKIVHNAVSYILKGYTIQLEHLKSGVAETKDNFMQSLSFVQEAYREYYLAKTAAVVSPHFAKPLIIDHELQLASDDNDTSYLYIEIIFETSGDPLSDLKEMSIDTAFNLMRQSANGLGVLHGVGLAHLDVSPNNMVYDEEKDLLQVINMESVVESDDRDLIYQPISTIEGVVRTFARVYASPEILKTVERGDSEEQEYVLGGMDVYSWGTSFYSMLLGRSSAELSHEADVHRLATRESHAHFVERVVADVRALAAESAELGRMREAVALQLGRALAYGPSERPTMKGVAKELKEFETANNIEIPYRQFEEENVKSLIEMLTLEEHMPASNEEARPPTGEFNGKEEELKSESKMVEMQPGAEEKAEDEKAEELPAADKRSKSGSNFNKPPDKAEEEKRPLTAQALPEGLEESKEEPDKRKAYEYIADEAVDAVSVSEEHKTLTLGEAENGEEAKASEPNASEDKPEEEQENAKKIMTLKMFEERQCECLNAKAELTCGHSVCKECLVQFVMEKFFTEERYGHQVTCKICKEERKLSNLMQ